MYGANDLKTKIKISDLTVECPVKNCVDSVPRQRKHFYAKSKFQCPVHNIYISPTTFEYPSDRDNILIDEQELLNKVKKVKRESRIKRDNSEDALSWNVFRYLEKSKHLRPFLESFSGNKEGVLEDVVYWSFSQKTQNAWPLLNQARELFGEELRYSSEPDIAIVTSESIFFIEAKLTASNKTSGTGTTLKRRIGNPKRYISGYNNWFSEVFKTDYETILKDQKYELMRFWLLGTWMAKEANRHFYLLNLVPGQKENTIEREFLKHVNTTSRRHFMRITWENIYRFVKKNNHHDDYSAQILHYMRNKTIGYDHEGSLRKAFGL